MKSNKVQWFEKCGTIPRIDSSVVLSENDPNPWYKNGKFFRPNEDDNVIHCNNYRYSEIKCIIYI